MNPHSCHNHAPPKEIYWVQDGWTKDGKRKLKATPYRMSKGCRYAADGYAANDRRCEGCSWKKI